MHTEDDVKALAEKLLEIPLTCGIERTATDIWLTREKANALARVALEDREGWGKDVLDAAQELLDLVRAKEPASLARVSAVCDVLDKALNKEKPK